MALEAPGHALGFVLEDDVHFVDLAVTTDATYAAAYVDGVVEVGVVGNVVNLDPGNWFTCSPAVTNGLKFGVVLLNVAVTIHTGLRGGKIGMAANFDVAVAITAVHAKLGYMELVIKGNGLNGLVSHAGIFRREVIPDSDRHQATDDPHSDERLKQDQVGSFGKNIGHVAM